METRRILLRGVDPKDYPEMFVWRNYAKFRNFVHYNSSTISFEDFVREFERDAKVRPHQYLIERKETGELIGLIFSHTLSKTNGYCFINLFISEKYERKGFRPEAFALLFCHLFDSCLFLHKIYLEVFEYNQFSLSSLTTAGFKEEGRFKEHKWHKGKRYDVIRFAAYRDSVPRFAKIIEKFF